MKRGLICALLFGVLCAPVRAGQAVSLPWLAQTVQQCSTGVGVRVMTATVIWEHRGVVWPWTIGVNATPHQSFTFTNEGDAVAKAQSLYAQGFHSLDIGLAQVNTTNFASYGLTQDGVPDFTAAFAPCENVHVGSEILGSFYRRAVAKYGATPYALYVASKAYNTGSFDYGDEYARSVWEIAASLPEWIGARVSVGLQR